jgi:hypothetical protein
MGNNAASSGMAARHTAGPHADARKIPAIPVFFVYNGQALQVKLHTLGFRVTRDRFFPC